jgi:hypothetical protein
MLKIQAKQKPSCLVPNHFWNELSHHSDCARFRMDAAMLLCSRRQGKIYYQRSRRKSVESWRHWWHWSLAAEANRSESRFLGAEWRELFLTIHYSIIDLVKCLFPADTCCQLGWSKYFGRDWLPLEACASKQSHAPRLFVRENMIPNGFYLSWEMFQIHILVFDEYQVFCLCCLHY